MSTEAGFGSRKPMIWDVLVGVGLLAALLNSIAALFLGAWISVPAHRAVEDGDSLPVYGLADIALHYTPFFLVLLFVVCAIVARWRGRQKWAAGLVALQILALLAVGAQIFPIP